jgi:signal transduction histidine kinase
MSSPVSDDGEAASKSLYSAGIIHDIRSHLTTIKLCSDFISNPDSLEIQETLVDAVREIESLLRNYQLGHLHISHKQKFNPYEVIAKMVQQARIKYKNTNCEIKLDLDESAITQQLDSYQRVINNILSNAFEVSPSKITISCRTYIKDNIHQLTISDNGEGIPKDKLSKVFSAGFSSKIGRDQHQGLGLYIVKELVEHSLVGRISVKSKLHKGTSFSLYIPTY